MLPEKYQAMAKGNKHKNMAKFGRGSYNMHSDRQTNMIMIILCSSTGVKQTVLNSKGNTLKMTIFYTAK